MPKPFTLKPLLDLSKSQLDTAAGELGKLVAKEQEGARKLELLQTYRAEYDARFREEAANGIGVEALRNYGAFIARIDDAIAAQRAQLEQSQQHTVAGKQAWVSQRNRVKAFDTLHDRHRANEQRNESKAEQRLSDEHSANNHHKRRNDESS